jgi:hypothetical protein
VTLDPAQDPDRFDAGRDGAAEPAAASLDPAADPDRYRSPTLPGLLGDGAQEGERNNVTWLIGLLSVFAFLGAISLLVRLGNG